MVNLMNIPYVVNGWNWGNAEKKQLAAYLPDNLILGDGITFQPKKENVGAWWREGNKAVAVVRYYSSGMIRSVDTFLYGYFKFIAKLPDFRGAWPAIWLFPTKAGWVSEIDIMEQFRKDDWWSRYRNQIGIYKVLESGKRWSCCRQARQWQPCDKGTMTYELIWTPDTIAVIVNGSCRFYSETPINTPMNLIMNLAIGDWDVQDDKLDPFHILLAEHEPITLKLCVSKKQQNF